MCRLASGSSASRLDGDWVEFWDYENNRILLFAATSQLFCEDAVREDAEILLNEGGLAWHLSTADEDGLAIASRAMWKANRPIAMTITMKASGTTTTTAQDSTARKMPRLPNGLSPNPVYGCAPELPNGQAAKTFLVRQQRLSAEDLIRPAVRAFLIWELQETMFRFQLRDLDTYILTSLGLWTPEVQQERETLWLNCWGAQDGFIPSGKMCPLLTNAHLDERKWGIYNLWKIVRAWPWCREVSNLRAHTATEGLSLETLRLIEKEVWSFYAQSFLDYFGILPTLPTVMPPNPFESAPVVS
ncbi:hypothetical protein AURDEDRAFT_172276 [Auricularia subglabra TFB-10046 SS5]|nr:hypothetical protein AURDEDRAFT_172276 [Auricularia subglabra TFB-10046 SS5]